MPPPRSKAAAAPAPQRAVEPEPLAPPAQPAAEHQYAQAADAHDGGQDDYGIEPAAGAHGGEQHDDAQYGADQQEAEHNGSLPPAPQLEAQLEALRAHAAAQARAHAAEAPRAETAAPSAPQRDWTPEPPLAPKRMAAGHGPINPDLPPDEPLEPGSGPPPLRANPAARIAASEADLDHRRPVPATDSASGSKLSFIAAARRAAQAAMLQDPKAQRAAEIAAHDDTAPAASPKRSRMMRRVKSLFVAASIVALVVGSVQIAATMLNLGKPDAPAKTSRGHLSLDQRADGTPTASIVRPSQQIASVQSPASITETAPAMTPPTASIDLLAPPDQTVRIATVPAADPRRTQANAAQPHDSSSADITGSIPEAAADHSTANPLAPAVDQRADLPAAIGSVRLREAAAAGDSAAAYEVAMRFADGRGVPADLSMAARWYERAASKGLAPAEFRLASMLEKGQGVKKNLARARSLYFAAARQGNAKAMHNLAVLFAEGVEGKPDYSAAVRWFRDAARHGVSDSQYNLGILYARGIGVEKSLTESYKWFALAAKHGDKEAAKKRDDVANHMDESDLAAARRLVAKFAPEPQPKQATTVAAPPGGWDKATAAQGGAFTVGKR
jgi:localization factor PodJL